MKTSQQQQELYFKAQQDRQIRNEYAAFVEERGATSDAHQAHLFALQKINGGHDYFGYKERDLILLLVGDLPHMYD